MNRQQSKKGPIILALLLIMIAGAVFLIQRYMPTKEKMDLKTYFGDYSDQEAAIVLQDQLIEARAYVEGSALYIPYELVRDELNSRFFWDEGNQQMLFTTALLTYEIPVNSTVYTIDGVQEEYKENIVLQKDSALYMSADFVATYTNIEYTLVEEESGLKHILLRNEWGTFRTAELKKTAAVRYQGGIKSPVLTTAEQGDRVYVLEELDNWVRVLTGNGFIGYVRTRQLTQIQDTDITTDFKEQEYPSLTQNESVTLVWHQIDYADANAYLKDDIKDMTGVNVISPTWFSVTDNKGTISSLGDKEYVKTAHKAGLEIWGLVNNFSADVDTTTLLSSTDARRHMAEILVKEAKSLGIEGINLDFEYIKEAAGYSYVQFVRELSIQCRKNGLVLSVDVPVPMDFNQYFNRKELGIVTDYVIVMGYDEHYVGSDPGSVASLNFEENGITGTLKDVPAEKIISGVPFYTRIWYTGTGEDGSETVTSEAVSMNKVTDTLKEWNVTPTWDDQTQQDYAAWHSNEGELCQVWIEDEQSLAKKARLVGQYKLGGIAAWVLGFERSSIWDVLQNNMSQPAS